MNLFVQCGVIVCKSEEEKKVWKRKNVSLKFMNFSFSLSEQGVEWKSDSEKTGINDDFQTKWNENCVSKQ